jgi:hypothetical protein
MAPIILGFRTLASSLAFAAQKAAKLSQTVSGLLKFGAGASKFLGPLLGGAAGYASARHQGYDEGDSLTRTGLSMGAGFGAAALTRMVAGRLMTTPHPAAILIGSLLMGGAAMYGTETAYDAITGGPPIQDGETLTNRSTRLVHNGRVSNVRSGEELRVGPIGSFAQQYRAMAAMGSQEVTIKDNRPIKIVLPNGKVLAEAVMPGVTKAVGKRLSPMMA